MRTYQIIIGLPITFDTTSLMQVIHKEIERQEHKYHEKLDNGEVYKFINVKVTKPSVDLQAIEAEAEK